MPTRKSVNSRMKPKPVSNGRMTNGEATETFQFLRRMVSNQAFSRAAFSQFMAGGGHKIDEACGYPAEIPFNEYKYLIDREGIANRANSIFPSESWAANPWVYETEEMEGDAQTDFEKKWIELTDKVGILTRLNRLDEISGIGRYGVLLIGTNDGRPPDQPFPGINASGENEGEITPHEITYLMPFDEGSAKIQDHEKDMRSKRYGKPLFYNLTLADPNAPGLSSGKTQKVHWSRCLHVADGCTSSDIIGTPRLQKVYNYIINIRKILGGSAEMFWHGGFPGTVFSVPPELVGTGELDKESLVKEIEDYFSGFKRYLAVSGVEADQLAPNIADPDTHLQVQMMALSIAMEVPMRVFLGSEEGRLASMNDSEAWNRRVHRRQDLHVTPNILRPFVDRLILMGVLPKPKEFRIKWPDVYSVSQSDKADITGKLVRALSEYIRSGAVKFFPPLQFLTMLMDFTTEESEEILSAAEEIVKSGKYDYLDPPMPAGPGKSQAGRPKPLGYKPKVKIGAVPSTNRIGPIVNVDGEELTVNPAMRCSRSGNPGFKYGKGGKCYTYVTGDTASKKKALRKAKLQGTAVEIGRHLQDLEAEQKKAD